MNNLRPVFDEIVTNYEKCLQGLLRTHQHCAEIGIKESYEYLETETFDALIIKLSRTIDLFFQQVVKAYLKLQRENPVTFIDRMHVLEQLNLIEDIEACLRLKDFRNQAVHEYADFEFQTKYQEAYELTLILQNISTHFFNTIDLTNA